MQALKNIKNLKQKAKLIIILSVEFIAIIAIILLVFFAGKKTHTVTFDLNGGILISGDLTQRVTQGQNAYPPNVAKYGHYLKGWSGSYKSITRDVMVKAIWEYETSPGIEYSVPQNTNYCNISGSFPEIQGEVFIGSYYGDRRVLGISNGAFKERTGITGVYLLDGILTIGDEAFSGCTNLEVIDIPSTVVKIGKNAFKGCENLKEIILPEALQTIDDGAFSGCSSLEGISIPKNVDTIGSYAFQNCTSLKTVEFYIDTNTIPNVPEVEIEGDGENEEEKPEEKPLVGVQSIGAYAFDGCDLLTEVLIPKTVVKIGTNAFTTAEMKIKLFISKEEIPSGYILKWYPLESTFVYSYGTEAEVEEPAEPYLRPIIRPEIDQPVGPEFIIDPDQIFPPEKEDGNELEKPFPGIKYPEIVFPGVEDEEETETEDGESEEGSKSENGGNLEGSV